MNEEFVGSVKEQLKTLFKQDEAMESRISKVEDSHKQLDKISYILELQQDINKEQTQTLNNINDNLVKLNSTVKTLETSVGSLNDRVDNLEDNNKIDTSKIRNELIYKVLPSSVIGLGIGLLVAFIAFKLGWNINL